MQRDIQYGSLMGSALRASLRGNNPFVLIVGGLIVTLGSILSLGLLVGPLSVGLAYASLRVVRGQDAEVEDLKAGFRNFVPSFVAGLLVLLAVALGLAALVVPGVIAMFLFMYTAHTLADDPELTAIEAIKESYAIARDTLSPTTVLFVVAAAISAVLSATGIGAVLAVAIIWILIAQFYVAADADAI